MKKSSNGIAFGAILLTIGLLWLFRKLDWLDIEWAQYTRFWPVLLILAGLSLLFSQRSNRSGGIALASGLIALAAVIGVSHRVSDRGARVFRSVPREWHNEWDGKRGEKKDKKKSLELHTETFEHELSSDQETASLHFEAGAGDFSIEGSSPKLFEASTSTSLGGFISNVQTNTADRSAKVNFKMEDSEIKLKNGNFENSAILSMNPKVVWDLDLNIGAGKGNFDLSALNVRKIKLQSGVSDVTMRLGDRQPALDVSIETGVAALALEVPEGVGCEIRIEGALNAKDIIGFERISGDRYRTSNYDTAEKKISVRYEAGLSKLSVTRY
jgi:hypothetical protein